MPTEHRRLTIDRQQAISGRSERHAADLRSVLRLQDSFLIALEVVQLDSIRGRHGELAAVVIERQCNRRFDYRLNFEWLLICPFPSA